MKLTNNIKHFLKSRFHRLKPVKKPVKFVMLLHFNQNFVPYLDFVALGYYNRLISVLRKFPQIPVVIHFSGTALCGTQWFNPSLIEMIKQGVKKGQFQLAESLYSQAIPYSISREEISLNIEIHRNILQEIFGEYENGIFWNPERIWHPDLLNIFESEKIKYSFIEDDVIKNNLGNEFIYSPLLHETKNNSTILLPDSNNMRVTLNNFLISGNISSLESIFRSIASKNGENVLVYAEDAEAFGLWEFEKNELSDIDKVFNNLSTFLSWIDSTDYIIPTRINEIKGIESPIPIKDFGEEQSAWLKRALKHENEKYHEEGYSNWFDYNKNSEKLKKYRSIQTKTTEGIEKNLSENSHLATWNLNKMSKLIELTKFFYVHHQYEFGCPGLIYGDDNYLERIKIAQIPPILLKEFQKREWCSKLIDFNNDGNKNLIIINHNFTLVFNLEGNMEFFFEMKSGMELSGGHIPNYILEKKGDDNYSNLTFNKPLWNWIKDYNLGHFGIKEYALRRLKFVEHFSINNEIDERIRFNYVEKESPIYLLLFKKTIDEIEFRKEYDCAKTSLIVRYRIYNKSKESVKLKFSIDTGFAPDYLSVIKNGRRSLNYYSNSPDENEENNFSFKDNGIGIMNSISNKGIHVIFNRETPQNVFTYDGLHNLCFKAVYEFEINENSDLGFSLNCNLEEL